MTKKASFTFQGERRIKICQLIVAGISVLYFSTALATTPEYIEKKPSVFANVYLAEPHRPRSSWMPIITFFLPGVDQFIEGQTAAGLTYSGFALTGFITAQAESDEGVEQSDIDARNNHKRQKLLGSQMYQTAGALSAYQSFRSTINIYKKANVAYQFMKSDDTSKDLMLAPFDFSFLKKPTTYIPLLLVLGVAIYDVENTDNADRFINSSDVGYLSAFSYQAGVGEEAIFRGYLMPSLRQSFNSDFWANFAQATIFSLAHISSDNKYPIWQLAGGYYWGWLTQKNKWSVRESVFIHAWWDIIAFTSVYLSDSKFERTAYMPVLNLEY